MQEIWSRYGLPLWISSLLCSGTCINARMINIGIWKEIKFVICKLWHFHSRYFSDERALWHDVYNTFKINSNLYRSHFERIIRVNQLSLGYSYTAFESTLKVFWINFEWDLNVFWICDSGGQRTKSTAFLKSI